MNLEVNSVKNMLRFFDGLNPLNPLEEKFSKYLQ